MSLYKNSTHLHQIDADIFDQENAPGVAAPRAAYTGAWDAVGKLQLHKNIHYLPKIITSTLLHKKRFDGV